MPAINTINAFSPPAVLQAANSLVPGKVTSLSGSPSETPGRPSTIVSISSSARDQSTQNNIIDSSVIESDVADGASVTDQGGVDSNLERSESDQREQANQEQQDVAEQQQIKELSARDREVRNHEQAHASAGGQYAGSPTYEFQRGPDGVNYAVGGHVSIDASAIPGNPEATIIKAAQVRRAALAPAEPSPQDRKVASLATQTQLQAQTDLAEIRQQERQEKVVEATNTDNVESGKSASVESQGTLVSRPIDDAPPNNNTASKPPSQNSAAINFITSNDGTNDHSASNIGSLISQII